LTDQALQEFVKQNKNKTLETVMQSEVLSLNLLLLDVSKTSTLIQGYDARLANRPFLVFDFRALALNSAGAQG